MTKKQGIYALLLFLLLGCTSKPDIEKIELEKPEEGRLELEDTNALPEFSLFNVRAPLEQIILIDEEPKFALQIIPEIDGFLDPPAESPLFFPEATAKNADPKDSAMSNAIPQTEEESSNSQKIGLTSSSLKAVKEEETADIAEAEKTGESIQEKTPLAKSPQALSRPPEIPPLAKDPAVGIGAEPIFSRIVRANKGNIVEIPFRGSGWVYLGERNSRGGIEYRGRRSDASGLTYIFYVKNVGSWDLSFYKQDFIQNYSINDYVRLIVGEADEGLSVSASLEDARVIAPIWPEERNNPYNRPESLATVAEPDMPLSDRPVDRGETKEGGEGEKTIEKIDDALPSLDLSKAALDREDLVSAISEALRFIDTASSASDMLYLAKLYEHAGPTKDIKQAYYWYDVIVLNFPQSAEASIAQKRLNYLRRFYFGIN